MRKLSAPSISIRSAVSSSSRAIVLLSTEWSSASSPLASSPLASSIDHPRRSRSICPGQLAQTDSQTDLRTDFRGALHTSWKTLLSWVWNFSVVRNGSIRICDSRVICGRKPPLPPGGGLAGSPGTCPDLRGAGGARRVFPIADYGIRLRALLAFNNIELDLIAFFERFVPIQLNR